MQVDLFATNQKQEPHPYAELGEKLWNLARTGIYLGSSSWKYESWKGEIYARPYKSKKDFEQNCLEEYARIFPAVGGDFSFYNWPSAAMVEQIATKTPAGFKIGLKCTETITIKRYPMVPSRWGERAGQENPHFLDAKLFREEFLKRIEPLRGKLAPVILEFTAFPRGTFADWREFARELERFLGEMPSDVQFGIEVRNRDFLTRDFWAALASMGTTPILNSWTRMLPLEEQWNLFTTFDFPFVECRAIMRPGRTHDECVELFSPYDRLRETVPAMRWAIQQMIDWSLERKRHCYIFMNNHMEGCAYKTIEELAQKVPASFLPELAKRKRVPFGL